MDWRKCQPGQSQYTMVDSDTNDNPHSYFPVPYSLFSCSKDFPILADNRFDSMRNSSLKPPGFPEDEVHEAFSFTGRDSLLVAVPMLLLLFIGFFRLDQILAAPKRPGRRRPYCGLDEAGEPALSDPVGQQSISPHIRH